MIGGSLRGRLILTAVVWLTIALTAAGFVLRWAFADSIERSFEQRLIASLRAVIGAVDQHPDGAPFISKSLGDPRFEQPLSGWYWQISSADLLLRSRSLWDGRLPASDDHDKFITALAVGPAGEALITVERDLTLPGLSRPVHAVVAASRQDIDDEIRRFDMVLLSAFGLLGLGLAASVAAQIGFGLRPLRRLAKDLAALRERPGERLASDYPSELKPLTETLNALLDHDSALLERARAHLGDLAHALKTPLAVLQAEIHSGAPDQAEIDGQIQRLTRLVEHHLARARAESDSARALGRSTAIAPVIEDAAKLLRKFNAGRNLDIETRIPPDLRFPGGAEDLAEMVGNLMENACKWAKSTIRVEASFTPTQGLSVIVHDDGPGLDAEQSAAMLARGARLDETAPGHGLGLSIVAGLAQLHGGDLELGRSPLGGLAAALRFA